MLVCLSVIETAGMCFMLLLSVSGQPKTNVHPDWKKKGLFCCILFCSIIVYYLRDKKKRAKIAKYRLQNTQNMTGPRTDP